jgi:hypothetical protein
MPEGINISSGRTTGMSYVEKFGRNNALSSDIETIWDGGGLYAYLTSASSVYVTSTSGNDAPAGTGAQQVTIFGLDENWNVVTEVIDIDDSATTITFIRVDRVIVTQVGVLGQADGIVSVRSAAAGGGILLSQIVRIGTGGGASLGQTHQCTYTVPAGKTAYIQQWTVGAGGQNADTSAFLLIRPFENSVFQTKDISISAGQQFVKNYCVPLEVAEKSDIEVRATSSGAGNDVCSSFNLIILDN